MATQDAERALISKVVNDRTYHELADQGISIGSFLDAEHIEKFDLLADHFTQHGASMGYDAFRANYPNYKLYDTPEPLSWYVDRVLDRHKYSLMQDIVSSAADALNQGDIEEAGRLLSDGQTELSATFSHLTDSDVSQHGKVRMNVYEAWSESPDALRGISFGFDSVDYTSRGAQPGNLIVIAGPQGVGKTTLLMKMALHMHELMAKVLFVSFEMPYEEIGARYDAMRAHISHHRLLRGMMTKADEKKLRRKAASDMDNEPFIVSEDTSSTTTISGLRAKIQQHQPDVVFVDGVYMMLDEEGQDSGTSQALTNISRGLKRTALGESVPIIASTQALESKMKGGRMTMSSIGYTSAFQQDASVVLGATKRVINATTGETDPYTIVLATLKSRNGPPVTSNIIVDWDEMRFDEDRTSWNVEVSTVAAAEEKSQGAKVSY